MPSPGKIKFKLDNGETAFSLKIMDDGAKLVDAQEMELARITRSGADKLKIKDSADKVLAYIVGNTPRFKVEDAAQQKTLFKFQQQDDKDWKLEDGSENTLAKIKHRDYGMKIVDANEKDLAKVKSDGGKTSIRGSNDKTMLYTNDSINMEAVSPFALKELSQPIQAALSLALIK